VDGIGIVYLVGAGPGDPGLLTLRGAEVLARADVVAHDRLVHPALLALATNARLVDVGKRVGERGRTQADINQRLIDEARAGNVVVRLKGGDPFVFGRGGEEAEALAAAGVAFEVVPGVTSAVAGPAYAGIPLTHRDHASWVAIATGHEDDKKADSGLDWAALAAAPTAVFLMGVTRLPDIARELQAAGRAPDTPAAIVASGTWPSQRVVRSTLATVASDAEAAGIEAPALIVVGEVTALGEELDWWSRRPLAGKRVFVTRTRAQAGTLSALLRELGAEPLEFPAIRIEPPQDEQPLSDALTSLAGGAFAWTIVTSANTVDAFERHLPDARAFGATNVAAIGPATAERLRAFGIRADLVPDVFTGRAVAEAFPAPAKGSRGRARSVLIARAEEAPDELPRLLKRKGWRCEVVPAYRTLPDGASVEGGRQALDAGVDAVAFTSGSTVRSFVELWGKPPDDALVCCIGPVTADVASELGLRVDAVADVHTVRGLTDALVEAVRR
jgi:uroporphyrinogen III methyltransferase / synthase